MKKHDLVVIGGGSGGYAAARTAHEAGANVAIVDPGPLGGLCILRGCMPTKTILRSSDIISLMRRAPEFGLLPVEPGADLAAIIQRKRRLIKEFADYRIEQLRDPRFTLYEERAVFTGPQQIQAGPHAIAADHWVVATGSTVSHIPIPGLDQVGYITSDEALEMEEQPASMLVLGGGAVALELAQFYQRIGTQVTLIQRSHHILSEGDEDLARPVEKRLREEGMEVFTGTQLHRFSAEEGVKTAHFSHQGEEKSARADLILQALGRRPNIEGLGLEAAGVETEHGRIAVDGAMRTSQPHIFAVGDVNGLHEIVHIAIEQGEIAAHNALHPNAVRRMDDRLKAQVVFTDPQVAVVGLSEKECQEEDIPYLVADYPFDDHGKSMTLGELHGHVKLLCHPDTGELLGGHIVGPEAAELIHELIAVMYFKGTVADLARIPHYHPTLAEILTYPAEELAEQIGVGS
ncbi:MAG: FAD-dependent oxidoreductase [Candidatus Latescibacteria bacterium]|nr:FAD-dependent oxidoreductase [Candidatus Latescibacterota bacterium]